MMKNFWSEFQKSQRRKLLNQVEKWRTTRASMDGVGSVLAWVACVVHLRGWCESVDGMLV